MAELTPDRVFEILESPRRRHALAYLSERSGRVHLDELAAAVAAREQRSDEREAAAAEAATREGQRTNSSAGDASGTPAADAGDAAVDDVSADQPDPEAVDDDRREQVRLSLYHVHLPKLATAGLVEFDRGDGRIVELTGDLGPLKPSLDIQQSEERREYYTN